MTNEEVIEVLYNNNYNYAGWKISKKAIELYKFRKNETEFELDFCCRNDVILVQIYKELGDDFDDMSSITKIKIIPKKYEDYYYIKQDDCGKEYIKIDKTKYKLDIIYNKIKKILQSNNNDNTKINEIEQFISAFEM
jgi:hypothetical protein